MQIRREDIQKTLVLCLVAAAAGWLMQTVSAQESAADPEKLAIIELIEDQLANAYSVGSVYETPDFGALDRIFPKWHGGDPSEARKTLDAYLLYTVAYDIFSVHITQPGMATVKGQKRVTSARKKKTLLVFKRTKNEKTLVPFTIVCRKNIQGDWIIEKEVEG